jgi:hypothetical protein
LKLFLNVLIYFFFNEFNKIMKALLSPYPEIFKVTYLCFNYHWGLLPWNYCKIKFLLIEKIRLWLLILTQYEKIMTFIVNMGTNLIFILAGVRTGKLTSMKLCLWRRKIRRIEESLKKCDQFHERRNDLIWALGLLMEKHLDITYKWHRNYAN